MLKFIVLLKMMKKTQKSSKKIRKKSKKYKLLSFNVLVFLGITIFTFHNKVGCYEML